MAVGFAIHNSMTNHGGIIPATQMRTSQMGNLFLVAGDGHFCPKCKCWSKIVKSHDHIILDGKAVAYVGDQLTCGAKILPKQSHVVGDSKGSSLSSNINNKTAITDSFANKAEQTENSVTFYFKNEVTQEPIANFFYTITLATGDQIDGHTDEEGKTALTTTGITATDVKIETFDLSNPMDKWE
ncbi:conserved hypothetical protein [Acinetobacter proteolyticus]|jgi:hypothetical protein|uniref:PAAR domain-containing protein n=1 Tax=Acinetobacter proteolyticus TaxID=1776741 RepID=A0A653K8A1_9GAMM|nr:PAAR domain-containing protein [Acinetobacter proteolyticus]VXA56665.1 conserved hypothetical protein [Acinetobacter proteolyticus]